MNRNKSKSVVGMISGLNRSRTHTPRKECSKECTATSNPLFNPATTRPIPPKRPSAIKHPYPTSPIAKKTKKGEFASLRNSPRSPLTEKDPNSITSPTTLRKLSRSNTNPIRPQSSRFQENLNETLRLGLPNVYSPKKGQPLTPTRQRKRPVSYYPSSSAPKAPKRIKNVSVLPSSLPPPPAIPTSPKLLPEICSKIRLPIRRIPQESNKEKHAQQFLPVTPRLDSLDDIITKLKKTSVCQLDLAVYQAIEMFCCNEQHHRSSRILCALLSFDIEQLVHQCFINLNSGRSLIDKRRTIDTLSSLVSLTPEETGEDLVTRQQTLLRLLSNAEYLPTLIKLTQVDDIVLRSNVCAVLAALHIEPSQYISTQVSPSSTPYSFDGIPKIVCMLAERNQEAREAALAAIICMGPIASEAVHALGSLLIKEKSPQLRILVCQALAEIGAPYALKAVHYVQEVTRKEKDESVKAAAQNLLERLGNSASLHAETNVVQEMTVGGCEMNEGNVRKAIYECSKAMKGVPITASDIKTYFLHSFPNLARENPGWKFQLRNTMQQMISKGNLTKTPATFALPAN